MRRLLGLVMAAALVTGCQIGQAPAGPAGDSAITEQALPPLDGATDATPDPGAPEAMPTAAPAPDPVPDPVPLPEPEPEPEAPMLAQQRLLCQRAGGQMMARAAGVFACVHPTRDGGQRCDAAQDCEGLCLARSGTCAPFAPLFGCQEVFTLPGRRETLCTE